MIFLTLLVAIIVGLLFGLRHYTSTKYKPSPLKIKSRAVEKITSVKSSRLTLEASMRRYPLFNFYPRETIDEILKNWKRISYNDGEVITTLGFVLQGEVEIIYGSHLICVKEKGSLLGGSMEFLGFRSKGMKKARGSVEILQIESSVIKDKMSYVLFSMLRKSCIETMCKYFELESKLVERETMKIESEHHLPSFVSFLNDKLLLNLSDDGKNLLRSIIETRSLIEEEVLKAENDSQDYIFCVISGEMIISSGENIFTLGSGCVFGYFSLFFDSYSSIVIHAKSDCSILICNSSGLVKFGLDESKFDYSTLEGVDEVLHVVDESSEWMRLLPGDAIIRKDDTSKEIFYILAGNTKTTSKEYSSGAVIGGRECIVGEYWDETCVAICITDVIRIPSQLLDYVFERDKSFFKKYIRRLFDVEKRKYGKIVSVIPTNKYNDIASFSRRLKIAIGPSSLLLGQKDISDVLTKRAFDTTDELKLMDYLTRMSKQYEVVLICIDNEYSRLMRYLLNFSDTLLVVGPFFADSPEYNPYCSVEFVRIYEERRASGEGIMRRIKSKMREKRDVFGKRGEMQYDRLHHVLFPTKAIPFCSKDFQRLARSLLGRRIGLVLSGGGARGLAHIGVIQALEEERIPIDCIGGTSMGAFIGALYAKECNNYYVFKQARNFARKMSNIWLLFLDLTYPICSMFSGRGFNNSLSSIFKDVLIQDLWLEYFCVSTNITTYEEEVHRDGIVWKYVRASMGICGYLPPVCDNKKLLIDGGYLNNVPADVMVGMKVDKIITVDVGTILDNDYFEYGDSLSGFTVLFNRFFGNKKFVTMKDIQYRLAYISTERKMRELEANENIIMLKPDLGKYRTMDFKMLDEIVACGYQSAKRAIQEWKQNGTFDTLFSELRRQAPKRRYSV